MHWFMAAIIAAFLVGTLVRLRREKDTITNVCGYFTAGILTGALVSALVGCARHDMARAKRDANIAVIRANLAAAAVRKATPKQVAMTTRHDELLAECEAKYGETSPQAIALAERLQNEFDNSF